MGIVLNSCLRRETWVGFFNTQPKKSLSNSTNSFDLTLAPRFPNGYVLFELGGMGIPFK